MKFILEIIGFTLRMVEVFLCLRKTPYKRHTFPKKKATCEYYHNIQKWKKPYN